MAEWVLDRSVDGILPGVNPLKVSGSIITAGGSTVFPLSERMVERFKDDGFGGNITVDSSGSGAGLERFCVAGETDIANASRRINAKEIESARKIGREPLGIRVGTDSGTFDYFVEEIFKKDMKPILNAANLRLSEDDNVLVQGVEGNPMSEYAPERFRSPIEPVFEVLAGIPTVVYGYFALTFLTPLLRSMCEYALSAVPRSLREWAYAVGASTFVVSDPKGVFSKFIALPI